MAKMKHYQKKGGCRRVRCKSITNQAACEILGVDCRQFIGKTIEEAFPPLVNTEVPERYRRACSEGVPWQTEQIDYEDEQIKGAYEVNAFQTAPGMMATMFRDITDRKQYEEELQSTRALLETAIDQSPSG